MTDKAISDDDHLSSYCRPATIQDEMPGAVAFRLREDEDYLSVNWLEYFKTDLIAAIDMVRDVLYNKRHKISKNGSFAIFNAGSVEEMVLEVAKYRPAIERVQDREDPSHAGIYVRREYAYATAAALAKYVRRNPDKIYRGTHN